MPRIKLEVATCRFASISIESLLKDICLLCLSCKLLPEAKRASFHTYHWSGVTLSGSFQLVKFKGQIKPAYRVSVFNQISRFDMCYNSPSFSMDSGVSTNHTDFVAHPLDAKSLSAKPQLKTIRHLPFDGTTTNSEDYKHWTGIDPVFGVRRPDSTIKSLLPFDGE